MEEANSMEEEITKEDNILKEKDKEELKEFLKANRSEDSKFIESLPSNNGILEAVNNTEEDIIEDAGIAIDPNTGSLSAFEKSLDDEMAKLLDIDVEDLYKLPESASEIPYDPELVKANAEPYGLDDNDMIALLPIIDEYRSGKQANWYNVMPKKIKEMINKECMELNNNSIAAKKLFAEEIIKGLIRDAGIDRLTIDLQESIKKAFDMSGIMKMTLDYQRTEFEDKLTAMIDKLEADGKEEKAIVLKKVVEAYKQSYTLEKFIAMAKTGKLRVKEFDIRKYKRYVEEFNYKYEGDTPFVIDDISMIAPILLRKFPEFTTNQVIAFVIAFCKFCGNLSSKDVADHTFMSYFILNIKNLDLLPQDQEEHEFTYTLSNNIREAIKIINNIEED